MGREKGSLPKAYLRISPDLDQHEDPGAMARLICVANRQPWRGRFRGDVVVVRAVGRRKFREAVARGDLVKVGDAHWYLDGWDEWNEGDLTVGERMRRLRERRNGTVTALRGSDDGNVT